MEKMIIRNIYIESDKWDRLMKVSEEIGVSTNQSVRWAISRYIDKPVRVGYIKAIKKARIKS